MQNHEKNKAAAAVRGTDFAAGPRNGLTHTPRYNAFAILNTLEAFFDHYAALQACQELDELMTAYIMTSCVKDASSGLKISNKLHFVNQVKSLISQLAASNVKGGAA